MQTSDSILHSVFHKPNDIMVQLIALTTSKHASKKNLKTTITRPEA